MNQFRINVMKTIYKYLLAICAATLFAPVFPVWADGDDRPTAPVLNKTIERKAGNNYTLTLESYVTGLDEGVYTTSDVVMVLDVSGSMREAFKSDYVKSSKTTLTFNDLLSEEYFIIEDGEYRAVYTSLQTSMFGGYRYGLVWWDEYDQTHQIGSYVNNADQVIYESEHIYTATTRIDGLRTAAKTFVKALNENNMASGTSLGNQIAIVKFASNSTNTKGNTYDHGVNSSQIVTTTSNGFVELTADGKTTLDNALDALHPGGATHSDYGMSHANNLLSQNTIKNNKHKKTVILFTDGVPGETGWSSTVANNAIDYAQKLKKLGYTVYTVGVFDSEPAGDMLHYMQGVSSMYPSASSYSNLGAQNTDGKQYYFTADTPEKLNEIFATMASESCADIEVDGTAIVKDQMTPSFELKGNIESGNIRVYKAKFNGNDSSDNPTWGTNEPLTIKTSLPVATDEVYVNLTESVAKYSDGTPMKDGDGNDIVTNVVDVQGFDFSENWVGFKTYKTGAERNHGYKLVIEIDIEIVDDAIGGKAVDTNTSASGIYSGDEFWGFTSPSVPIPINIKLRKYGLLMGESAVFTIYRTPDTGGDAAEYLGRDNQKHPYDEYMKLVVTGNGEQFTDSRISSLDPNYVYMLWEDDWSWTYQTQDQNGKITTRGATINPFKITNRPGEDVKHSEAIVTNDFKTGKKKVTNSDGTTGWQ